MQSIRSSKKSASPFKKVLLGVLVVLALTIVAAFMAYTLKAGPFASVPTPSSTNKQENIKKEIGTPAPKDPSSNSVKNPQNNDSPSQSSDKGLRITSTNINGGNLEVRTLLPVITNAGSCSVSATSSGNTAYTETVGVQALSSSSTCKGFDIPLSSLGAGTWTITVDYSNSAESSSATKEVVING